MTLNFTKSTHNIDVKGAVTGTSPAITVNNIKAKVCGANFIAEDVTLKSGANTITAKAVNSKATASKSINVTLDATADKLFTYDNNGSLICATFGAKQVTYTYDYENRLTALSLQLSAISMITLAGVSKRISAEP